MVVFGELWDLDIGREYRRSCIERRFGTSVIDSRVLCDGGCISNGPSEQGADANFGGATPMCIAAHEGRRAVAELLLDAGANVEAKDKVRGGWEWKGGEISSGAVRCTHGVVCYFKGCFCLGVKYPRIDDVGFSVHVSRFHQQTGAPTSFSGSGIGAVWPLKFVRDCD